MDKTADSYATEPVKPQPTNRFNKITGATSGPYAGNVMVILTIMLISAFLLGTGYVMVEVVHNARNDYKDLMIGSWGAISGAFTTVMGFYFGARTVERNK